MRTAARQEGFTLVEVLIGMVLTVIVFGATLTLLDSFSHQWQRGQQRLGAQGYARLGIDRIVRQLRNIASPVSTPKLLERATPYDVVFQTVGTPSGSNLSGAQRVRYCIPADPSPGSSTTEVLWGETQTWSTTAAPASPWSSDPTATLPCPDLPAPSGVKEAVVASAVTNRYVGQGRTEQPAFTFNNAAAPSNPNQLNQVFTVQISLFVNSTPTFPNAETKLTSAAFLRNQPRAPVPTFTPTLIEGGGGVLLNAGGSYSPDGEDLAYSWSCTSPAPCPDAAALASANTGLVVWRPGAGTYTVVLTVTDQTGLSAPSTQQVTVT
jgi:type II secretory pathway pseudopilin PulG